MEFLELFLNKIEGKTLSAAESVTGGTFASIITSQEGASKYFKGGVVVYSNKAKRDILNIDAKFGTVRSDVAKEMSEAVNKLIPADISISFTGNAGSKPMDIMPTGTSFIGITYKDKTKTYKFVSTKKDRNEIIIETVAFGFKKLIETL